MYILTHCILCCDILREGWGPRDIPLTPNPPNKLHNYDNNTSNIQVYVVSKWWVFIGGGGGEI